jgi:hypothetical protein
VWKNAQWSTNVTSTWSYQARFCPKLGERQKPKVVIRGQKPRGPYLFVGRPEQKRTGLTEKQAAEAHDKDARAFRATPQHPYDAHGKLCCSRRHLCREGHNPANTDCWFRVNFPNKGEEANALQNGIPALLKQTESTYMSVDRNVGQNRLLDAKNFARSVNSRVREIVAVNECDYVGNGYVGTGCGLIATCDLTTIKLRTAKNYFTGVRYVEKANLRITPLACFTVQKNRNHGPMIIDYYSDIDPGPLLDLDVPLEMPYGYFINEPQSREINGVWHVFNVTAMFAQVQVDGRMEVQVLVANEEARQEFCKFMRIKR